MRPFEASLALVLIAGGVCLFLGRPRLSWVVGTIAAVLLLLQVAIEGARIQGAPAYLGMLFLLVGALSHALGPLRICSATLVVVCGLAGLVAFYSYPMLKLPVPGGPYAIGVSTFLLHGYFPPGALLAGQWRRAARSRADFLSCRGLLGTDDTLPRAEGFGVPVRPIALCTNACMRRRALCDAAAPVASSLLQPFRWRVSEPDHIHHRVPGEPWIYRGRVRPSGHRCSHCTFRTAISPSE